MQQQQTNQLNVEAAWWAYRESCYIAPASSQARALNSPLVCFLACRTSYISLLLTRLVGSSHLRAFMAGATALAKFALRSHHLRCAILRCRVAVLHRVCPIWHDRGTLDSSMCGRHLSYVMVHLNTLFLPLCSESSEFPWCCSCSGHLLKPPINQADLHIRTPHLVLTFFGESVQAKDLHVTAAIGVHHEPPICLPSCLQL